MDASQFSIISFGDSDKRIFDHISFIKDVAATRPPMHLSCLIKMLQIRGESIISPGAKQGFIPIVVPLTRNSSGALTALLRWPTAPPGLELPVVEVCKHGIRVLAKDVDHYIHRILVEEDVNGSSKSYPEVFEVSSEAGENCYKKGDFIKSQISNLDDYLLRKVGLFPDVLERKVMHYYEKGDHLSALVMGDFYTKKEHFLGIGRPFVFNAEVLLKLGRDLEAKNAARGALKSPWWTLGCRYQEVASIAQWDVEPIEDTKKRLSKERKQEDLSNGKSPEQIAIDEAASLLNLASVDGTWDQYTEVIAECYKTAGLHDIARFVNCKEIRISTKSTYGLLTIVVCGHGGVALVSLQVIGGLIFRDDARWELPATNQVLIHVQKSGVKLQMGGIANNAKPKG